MNIADKLTIIAENEQKVYDKGRTDEWSDFWDGFQNYGKRTKYTQGFYAYNNGCLWNDDMFKPKYDIVMVGSASEAFRGAQMTNVKDILVGQGIVLDTSQATSVRMMFQSCDKVTHLPEIDASKTTDNSDTVFSYCSALHTVDKFIVRDDGTLILNHDFHACYALKNIRFGGVIGRDISFQHSSLLSVESMKDVIAHLADYSTANTDVYTLTFTETCWTALEADSSAPDGGTWKDYVRSLGWLI